MARDEIPELRQLRDEYDRAREALMAAIGKHLDQGESNARIARSVDWSREYIARIRKEREPGAGGPTVNSETGDS
ncbi:hypothetical protein [Streptomyces mirabilis]|uniref:hypothetical protein n=1 Tax=Streptomyces mirabilis TaxID=68239 RepID=UPI0036DAD91D